MKRESGGNSQAQGSLRWCWPFDGQSKVPSSPTAVLWVSGIGVVLRVGGWPGPYNYLMGPGVLSLVPLHWWEDLGPRLSPVQAVFPGGWLLRGSSCRWPVGSAIPPKDPSSGAGRLVAPLLPLLWRSHTVLGHGFPWGSPSLLHRWPCGNDR